MNNIIASIKSIGKYRLFAGLNIIGLSISISVGWIIYRLNVYEFSYEQNLPAKNKIYRVISGFVFDEKEQHNSGVSKPLYQGIRNEINGLDYAVPLYGQYIKSIEINQASDQATIIDEPKNIAATDSSYFAMLPYRWIAGSASYAFRSPNSVVLTESRANKYFPGKNPNDILNQTIRYYGYNDTIIRKVTGIVAEYPAPTEFNTQEFCSLPVKAYELAEWTNTNGSDLLYLQLKNGVNPDKIKAQIDSLSDRKRKAFEATQTNNFKYKQWHELLPLKESHFATKLEYDGRKANKTVLYGLMGIALFLIILACINYINMSIASIPQRAKEIGVRKTLGSSRSQLIGQFISETCMITLTAGLLSVIISKLEFRILKDIIPIGVTAFPSILEFGLFILFLSILISILAGIYPAWLITQVKSITVFKHAYNRRTSYLGFSLQKTLIVFQFTIALVFISSAIIIGKQLHYILTADLGFDRAAVILARPAWKYLIDKKYENKQFTLLNELRNIPGIDNISLGTEPMSNNYSSSPYLYDNGSKDPIERQVFKKSIDTSYLGLYNMKLVAGRNLRASDTTIEYVINETAVHTFGFTSPQDAIGKMIGPREKLCPIAGVVKDFHQRDFYSSIDPLSFESDKENLSNFNIKLAKDPSQWQKTIQTIKQKWYQFYPPESFQYKFYDESIAQLYEKEQQIAKLVNIATVISIFISCLGLFGLAVLTVFQRTKEIGIRKLLGSSVTGILKLISEEYIILVMIAFLIATPITWWGIQRWLEKFVYRINIEWWMFISAGLLAVLIALITVSSRAIKAALANPVKSLRSD